MTPTEIQRARHFVYLQVQSLDDYKAVVDVDPVGEEKPRQLSFVMGASILLECTPQRIGTLFRSCSVPHWNGIRDGAQFMFSFYF